MRREYKKLGFDIGNSESPIIPIIIGDYLLTLKTWRQLFDNGVFVNAIVSPATPPGRQLLRTSYMATHTEEQLDQVLTIFEKVGKKLGLI
jgi:8-amino-7-oxononanoate synthase